MGDASTLSNIAARQAAQDLIACAGEQPERFWEIVVKLATAKLPPVPDPKPPMTEAEAVSFERTRIPYGKYVGVTLGDVPVSYLLFIAEGDDFARQLRRYVKSRIFMDRQNGDSED